jgi:hypothetical protein
MNLKAIRIRILYPDRREVSAEQIVTWARDAFANHDIAINPICLADAIASLEDAGLVTFRNDIDAILQWPASHEVLED